MDISALSDIELRQQLVLRGLNPGPVIASTRRIYEQKLYGLINKENASHPEGDFAMREDGDHAYVAAAPESFNVSTSSSEEQEDDVVVESDSGSDGEEYSRVLSEEEIRSANRGRSLRTNGQAQTGEGFGPKIFFGVTIICVLCVFLFFLSDHVNKATQSSNDDEVF